MAPASGSPAAVAPVMTLVRTPGRAREAWAIGAWHACMFFAVLRRDAA
jgi:hypothetical protein